MSFLRKKRGWPIPIGVAFAIIELLSFIISERPLGASRGYATLGSIIEYILFPEHAETVSYWQIYEPYIEWTVALLLGVITGSLFSSVYSRDFRIRVVPEMWKTSRGPSIIKRCFWALIGGIFIGFGARMAGGCTLGMLISGSIQLAPAGFIFMISLWLGATGMTVLFYRFKTLTIKRR